MVGIDTELLAWMVYEWRDGGWHIARPANASEIHAAKLRSAARQAVN
jgi:hypothetical protein